MPFTLLNTLPYLKEAKSHGKIIVLATGVFDVLHHEHSLFLQKAKAAGDILIVGLEPDSRVRQLKGESRPINPQQDRAENLAKLGVTDYIFIIPEPFNSAVDHQQLIQTIKPDILAVSSHTSHQPAKQAIIQQFGGKLQVVHSHNPAISSTHIINRGK